MGWTYEIYTPLSFTEADALADACQAAFDKYLEEHPGADDDGCVLPEVSGHVPRRDEVFRNHREMKRGVEALGLEANVPEPHESPAVWKRLETCQSALVLDKPTDSPLQVAVVLFLLERAGPGAFLRVETIELSEDAQASFQRERHPKSFGRARAPIRRRAIKQRQAQPGELEALALSRVLQAALEDVMLRRAIERALAGASELAERYSQLLLEGPISHRAAAKSLGCKVAEVERSAAELEKALAGLG